MACFYNRLRNNETIKKALLYGYSIILTGMHIYRMNNPDLTRDEPFSVLLARKSWSEITKFTGLQSEHPPLYYYILKFNQIVIGDYAISYRLTSIIPFLIVVVFCVFVIRKHIGYKASCIFISCLALFRSSFMYITQVRMYEWCLTFVFFAFITLRYIYHNLAVKKKHETILYFLLSFFSLCAAYTHYYGLVTVSFLYLFFLVWCVANKKVEKWLLSAAVSLIGYIPGMYFLLDTFHRDSNSYWIQRSPTVLECITNVFFARFGWVIFALFVLLIVLFYLQSDITDSFSYEEVIGDRWWFANGLFGFFGMIMTALIVSKLVRPLFDTRYIYTSVCICWIILATVIRYSKKDLIFYALLLLIIIPGFGYYKEQRIIEVEHIQEMKQSVSTIQSALDKGNYQLVTDSSYFTANWILDYYFPQSKSMYTDTYKAFITDNLGDDFILIDWFCNFSPDSSDTLSFLSENNYSFDTIGNDMYLAGAVVDIYVFYYDK